MIELYVNYNLQFPSKIYCFAVLCSALIIINISVSMTKRTICTFAEVISFNLLSKSKDMFQILKCYNNVTKVRSFNGHTVFIDLNLEM